MKMKRSRGGDSCCSHRWWPKEQESFGPQVSVHMQRMMLAPLKKKALCGGAGVRVRKR